MSIDDIDRSIMCMRSLGYEQKEIGLSLCITQSAVSQRIEKIRKIVVEEKGNFDKIFWKLMLGETTLSLLRNILK